MGNRVRGITIVKNTMVLFTMVIPWFLPRGKKYRPKIPWYFLLWFYPVVKNTAPKYHSGGTFY